MKRQFWLNGTGWLSMVAIALGSGAIAQAQRVEEEEEVEVEIKRPTRVKVVEERQPAEVRVRALLEKADAKGGRYWIGVSCSQAGEALRTQLGLSDGQGLVVDEVVDKSPAEKSGLRKFDVLVAAGDKPLKSLDDLVSVVQNAKESAIKLLVLRGGRKETVTVTPSKSPQDKPGFLTLEVPAEGALREWLGDQTQLLEVNPEGHFTIRRVHPGIALKHKTLNSQPLPKNVAITITKSGDEPAKITVKRDEKSWEVAEDKIDELPEDLRKLVRSFLGQMTVARISSRPTVRATPSVDFELTRPGRTETVLKALTELRKSQGEAAKGSAEKRSVEERLESLDKKLEKLQRAIEELRK
jgi:membrane-associated protease RseP (regulator of RpoE activity)